MNAQPHLDEFCPRCGHWVTTLRERTGWCTACSGSEVVDGQVCIRCLKSRPHDHYRHNSGHNKVCRACRTAVRNAWRQAHLETSRAYERMRRRGRVRTGSTKSFGRGRCPVCECRCPLLSTGVVASHQPGRKWVAGGERCGGYGQAPVTG